MSESATSGFTEKLKAQRKKTKPNGHDPSGLAFQCDGKKRPLGNHYNIMLVLDGAPEFSGVFAFDEHARMVVKRKPPPWASASDKLHDADFGEACNWLQKTYGIPAAERTMKTSLMTVAYRHKFHPVRDYLSELRWDGISRLKRWVFSCLGAISSDRLPEQYLEAVGECWMISAVARIFNPGCKADCMLILEGDQGTLKSTALQTLACKPQWFSDRLSDLSSKDAAQEVQSVWIVEMAEGRALEKSDIKAIKAWLSRRTDFFRPPYAYCPDHFPRQCIFAMTTNPSTYNYDASGGRRLWPVVCGMINIPALSRDLDQLWAEAVHCYRAGQQWWLTKEIEQLAENVQADRLMGHPWDNLVRDFAEGPERVTPGLHESERPWRFSTRDSICADDVLIHAVGKAKDKLTSVDYQIVGSILTTLGYKPKTVYVKETKRVEKRWLK